jgi:hypothetical protein
MLEILYTNVPCGGICDEVEEWASGNDWDGDIEFPCDDCKYRNYYIFDDKKKLEKCD